jgi:hypothetical protein
MTDSIDPNLVYLVCFLLLTSNAIQGQLCSDPGFTPHQVTQTVKDLIDTEIIDMDMDGDNFHS